MLLVILLAFGLTVVFPFVLFPKVRLFLTHWVKGLVLTSKDTNIVLVAVTFTSMLVISVVTFLLYKVACSAWAYWYTGDLVEQLVYSRGVFSLEIESQTPFRWKSLLSLLGGVALQMAAGLFLYRSVGHMMRRLNQGLNIAAFNQESQLVFSFLGTCFFVSIDMVFYAQNIAIVSQYANILLLVLAKISTLSSLICVVHWQLLKKNSHLGDVRKYLQSDSIWRHRLAKPVWVLGFGYIFALLCHLPAFLGLQFLQNNLVLFILNGLVLFVFFMYGYKRIFRQILDVLGRIMLLPEIGNSGLTPYWSTPVKMKWLVRIMILLGLIALLRRPALLAFFLLFPTGLSALMLIGSAVLALFLAAGLLLSVAARQKKLEDIKQLMPDPQYLLNGGKQGLFSLLHTLRPVAWMIGGYLLLISAFPKPYPEMGEKYSRSLLGKQGTLLYQEVSDEGFYALPIGFEALPPHLVESLVYQEDRGFLRQRSLLPNGSNWFGLSFAALMRFMSHGGGGSNLNMQLVKNEAYQGRRVQDVQRKFYELIAAFQLSLKMPSEEIMALYLNRVPMYGGHDFKGLYMASMEAFGIPPDQLNELQGLLLVWSLKNSNAFRLPNGSKVPYRELYRYEHAVKSVLTNRLELWKRQGLLDETDFKAISRKKLGLIGPDHELPLEVSTREFLKAQFAKNEGVIPTSLSEAAQEAMEVATGRFAREFKDHMKQGQFSLAYSSVAVEVSTGRIIAHQSNGPSTTDLVDFGHGYPVGSLMKPPVILSLLESGLEPEDIKLYDGKIGNPVAPNFSGKYSNRKVGIERMLAYSLNAPFNNIKEIANPAQVFKKNESFFQTMGITNDPAIDLDDKRKRVLHQINYPLGNRRMTLLEVAQVYQTIFNKGQWIPLSASGINEGQDTALGGIQIYEKQHCELVKKAMAATVKRGTGWRLKSRLPKNRTFYAKTGTSDKATHGWTVLSDGKLLIVSWLSYANRSGNRLDFNDQSVAIPYGSGSRSAGVLAAMVYKELDNQKFKNSGGFRTLYSSK